MGFVAGTVAMVKLFLQVLPFSPVTNTPPMLHTDSYTLALILLETGNVVKILIVLLLPLPLPLPPPPPPPPPLLLLLIHRHLTAVIPTNLDLQAKKQFSVTHSTSAN